MPTIDHIYELRYRREMSEIARALGLDPGKVAEGDALTAILDAISKCVIRTKEAEGDANYWFGRYEELCAEIDALREGRAGVWNEGFEAGEGHGYAIGRDIDTDEDTSNPYERGDS